MGNQFISLFILLALYQQVLKKNMELLICQIKNVFNPTIFSN